MSAKIAKNKRKLIVSKKTTNHTQPLIGFCAAKVVFFFDFTKLIAIFFNFYFIIYNSIKSH